MLISVKRILYATFICLTVLTGFVTENPLEKTIQSFERYLKELPQEKIYIHFDKSYYSSGETIWFKAYLVAGPLHEVSPLSHVMHIELIDQSKKIILYSKLYTDQGSVASQFLLPDSLPTGNYLVRAYTQWMKNFSVDYFFHQPIKIFNTKSSSNFLQDKNKIDLQFFPEGGELVYGLRSKVAFKAIGQDGLGQKIKGEIIDGLGNKITAFESNSLGMGSCVIVPERGKKYKAILENNSMEIPMPIPLESGVVMAITNNLTQNDVIIRIQTDKPSASKSNYLLAQTRGLICYASQINFSNPISFVRIPKSHFPAGVSQITLLDEVGNPIAERLIFIDDNRQLKIEMKADKKTYKPREKITFSIEVKDADGNPTSSDLSLSVIDDQQVLFDEKRENIFSYLSLSSDLKGYIESPGYYFNPANSNRAEDLDLLLLTQGWRRFIPQAPFLKPSFEVERGIVIRGKLLDKFNDKPISEGKVTYLSTFPIADIKVSTTSSNGEFSVPPIIYFDSAQAVLQGETKKGNKWVKFIIDSSTYSPAVLFPISNFNGTLTDYEKEFLRKAQEKKLIDASFDAKTRILDEVEIIGKKQEELYEPHKIYGSGSTTVQVANVASLENLLHPLQLLQGRVAGVRVVGGGLDWTVSIGGIGSINAGTSPLILVNNIPVDINYLSQLSVRDIESFDVWKGPETAVFGSRGANGVIAFYTRAGNFVFEPTQGISQIKQTGFQTPRQFYTPQYDVQKPEHIKPDRRITLFWAPVIRTDSTGKATVSFYNHDLETSVTGIIEGLSSTGVPGVSTINYLIQE